MTLCYKTVKHNYCIEITFLYYLVINLSPALDGYKREKNKIYIYMVFFFNIFDENDMKMVGQNSSAQYAF